MHSQWQEPDGKMLAVQLLNNQTQHNHQTNIMTTSKIVRTTITNFGSNSTYLKAPKSKRNTHRPTILIVCELTFL